MKYKCVFSDLDRTFIDGNGVMPEENRQAVERIIEKGIPFVPATGRAFMSLPKCLFEIKGIKYAITSNGVAIYDLESGERVFGSTLPAEFPEEFFRLIENEGMMAVEVYYSGRAYAPREYVEDPVRFNHNRVEYVQSTRTPVDDIRAFALEHKSELDGLTIIAPAGRLEELLSKVRQHFEGKVYITSSDGIYIELSNIACGKHNGLLKMCEILSVPSEETIAFGDNDNDIEMLEAAGTGVCVANGTEGCKRAADIIAPTCEEAGVAKLLAELIK